MKKKKKKVKSIVCKYKFCIFLKFSPVIFKIFVYTRLLFAYMLFLYVCVCGNKCLIVVLSMCFYNNVKCFFYCLCMC